MKNSPLILVIGMHRSGTSAIAGALSQRGVDFGGDLIPCSEQNPKGFFEDKSIVAMHEELLGELNCDWKRTPKLDADWETRSCTRIFEEKLRDHLESSFPADRVRGIKDPRLCVFLPVWLKLLREMKRDYRILLVTRHPLDVAASLERRNQITTSYGHLLWLDYLARSLESLRFERRVAALSFENAIANEAEAMSRIMKNLSLDVPGTEANWIESKLVHQCRKKSPAPGSEWEKRSLELHEAICSRETFSGKSLKELARLAKKYFSIRDAFVSFDGLLDPESLDTVQLFHSVDKGFEEAKSLARDYQRVGDEAADFAFTIPLSPDREELRIRLDPSRSPGLFTVSSATTRFLDGEGEVIAELSIPLDEVTVGGTAVRFRKENDQSLSLLSYGIDPSVVFSPIGIPENAARAVVTFAIENSMKVADTFDFVVGQLAAESKNCKNAKRKLNKNSLLVLALEKELESGKKEANQARSELSEENNFLRTELARSEKKLKGAQTELRAKISLSRKLNRKLLRSEDAVKNGEIELAEKSAKIDSLAAELAGLRAQNQLIQTHQNSTIESIENLRHDCARLSELHNVEHHELVKQRMRAERLAKLLAEKNTQLNRQQVSLNRIVRAPIRTIRQKRRECSAAVVRAFEGRFIYSVSFRPETPGSRRLIVEGWCFREDGALPDEFIVRLGDETVGAVRVERPDVMEQFPDYNIPVSGLGFFAMTDFPLVHRKLTIEARFGEDACLLLSQWTRQTLRNKGRSLQKDSLLAHHALHNPETGIPKQEGVLFHIETPRANAPLLGSNLLTIRGWAFDTSGSVPSRVFARIGDRVVPLRTGLVRSDVFEAHSSPDYEVPRETGFQGAIDAGIGFRVVEIIAEWEDGSRYLLGQKAFIFPRNAAAERRREFAATRKRHRRRNHHLRKLYRAECASVGLPRERTRTVDVIIPVYRGLEETRACLESLYEAADANRRPFEIVVIDDKSPEPELSHYLQGEAMAERIVLLRNQENLGFVGTVNRGMSLHPDRDVILLNSDTEVFHNWIDRICDFADRDESIATITPFSNNATICSYPVCGDDNPIPADTTPARLDLVCAEENKGIAHHVPSGVGFCMYISRHSLDQLGYFDEATFGKGYGEENDFCCRADLEGWKNLLLCDTFVYHKGAVSFQDSKNPKIEKAVKLLNDFYPGYNERVQGFLKSDPVREERLRIDRWRLEHLPADRILCISNNRGGGTLQHIVDSAEHAPAGTAMLLARPAGNERSQYRIEFLPEKSPLNTRETFSIRDLVDFCEESKITELEFHHFADQGGEILELPRLAGLPYRFIGHDYFSLCPQITLTNPDGRYCGEPNLEQCEACLVGRPVDGIESVESWRIRNQKFLNGASEVTCPSEGAADHFRAHFPKARISARHHREDRPEELSRAPIWKVKRNDVLTVGILGALSKEKGADLLVAAATDARKRQLPIRFVLFGFAYREIAAPKLKVTGPYTNEDLDDLFEEFKPHLFWFPALWPESYSYTLSITMERRYPVIVPNLGAFPERVESRGKSIVIPWDLPAEEVNDLLVSLQTGDFDRQKTLKMTKQVSQSQ